LQAFGWSFSAYLHVQFSTLQLVPTCEVAQGSKWSFDCNSVWSHHVSDMYEHACAVALLLQVYGAALKEQLHHPDKQLRAGCPFTAREHLSCSGPLDCWPCCGSRISRLLVTVPVQQSQHLQIAGRTGQAQHLQSVD